MMRTIAKASPCWRGLDTKSGEVDIMLREKWALLACAARDSVCPEMLPWLAERALLAFSREVVVNVRVPDAMFAAVRQHLSDQEIVESIFTIGCYMMMARLTEATETDLDAAAGMTLFDSGKKRTA